MAIKIRIKREANDLEIHAGGQRLVIPGHYQHPRLFTLDPMRSRFSKRRSTLFHLQHQLHMMTGWLGMAMHAERVLHEAKGMKDGDTGEIEV